MTQTGWRRVGTVAGSGVGWRTGTGWKTDRETDGGQSQGPLNVEVDPLGLVRRVRGVTDPERDEVGESLHGGFGTRVGSVSDVQGCGTGSSSGRGDG